MAGSVLKFCPMSRGMVTGERQGSRRVLLFFVAGGGGFEDERYSGDDDPPTQKVMKPERGGTAVLRRGRLEP